MKRRVRKAGECTCSHVEPQSFWGPGWAPNPTPILAPFGHTCMLCALVPSSCFNSWPPPYDIPGSATGQSLQVTALFLSNKHETLEIFGMLKNLVFMKNHEIHVYTCLSGSVDKRYTSHVFTKENSCQGSWFTRVENSEYL